jgi:hypothetical protein
LETLGDWKKELGAFGCNLVCIGLETWNIWIEAMALGTWSSDLGLVQKFEYIIPAWASLDCALWKGNME